MAGKQRNGGAWANAVFENSPLVKPLTTISAVGVATLSGTPATFMSVCFDTTLPSARDVASKKIASPADAESIFKIDAETGQITVTTDQKAAVLDFESVGGYSVEITVEDDGQPPMLTKTNVEIEVVNVHEAPIIVSTPCAGFRSCITVPENTAEGKKIGLALRASDQDLGQLMPAGSKRTDTVTHGPLVWTITGGNWGSRFAIDRSTGQISVARAVDPDDDRVSMLNHEETYVEVGGKATNAAGNPVFHLTVTVTDPAGLEDEALVEVAIADVNEPPYLEDTMRRVPENAEKNHLVGPALDALDEDSAATAFGKFQFSIESVQHMHFNYLKGTAPSGCSGEDGLKCTITGPFTGRSRKPVLTCTGAPAKTLIPAGSRVLLSKGTTTTSLVAAADSVMVGTTSTIVVQLDRSGAQAARAGRLTEAEGADGWSGVCPSWKDSAAGLKTLFAVSETTGQISVKGDASLLDFEGEEANLFRLSIAAVDNLPTGPGKNDACRSDCAPRGHQRASHGERPEP